MDAKYDGCRAKAVNPVEKTLRESQEKQEAEEKDKNDGTISLGNLEDEQEIHRAFMKHEIDVTKMQNPAKKPLKQDSLSSIRLPLYSHLAGVGPIKPEESKADYTDFARLQSGVSGLSGDGATEKTPNQS